MCVHVVGVHVCACGECALYVHVVVGVRGMAWGVEIKVKLGRCLLSPELFFGSNPGCQA